MSQHVLVSGILMVRLNGSTAKHPFQHDKSLNFFPQKPTILAFPELENKPRKNSYRILHVHFTHTLI